jgi:tRNA (cmo5U34)-methyltransferase
MEKISEFDHKAAGWDSNPMHIERSKAVAAHIENHIALHRNMSVLEYGAGTGNTSIILSGRVKDIVMMDSSSEMVKMMNEKIEKTGITNLKALQFDLEKDNYDGGFDLIFTQMVLHHVRDVESVVSRFAAMLNPCGHIAIADLYPEDGSFHSAGFNGHNGFDPGELTGTLRKLGFINVFHNTCFTIRKDIPGNGIRDYDIFILTARLG